VHGGRPRRDPRAANPVAECREGPLQFSPGDAGTDHNAIGVLQTMTTSGLQCPAGYALIDFDNIAVAPHLGPGQASSRQLLDTTIVAAVRDKPSRHDAAALRALHA
jgi:hypothetical protein